MENCKCSERKMYGIKVINKSENPLPTYSTSQSAGMDLRASVPDGEVITILPGKRALISTGLSIELPDGFEAQVRPRSGLAINKGITVLNSPGTVDADFRGTISVILINLGDEPFEVKNGDRIAQMVISRYEKVHLYEGNSLSKTERGNGGFGHTGVE